MISVIAVALVAAALAPPDTRFVLQGQVLDPSHAPILGATVSAVAADQKSRLQTLSNAKGEFTLKLAAGEYAVTVGAAGFEPLTESITAVDSGREACEFVLSVAGL